MVKLIITFIILLTSLSVQGQIIKGQVVNERTELPISFANVKLTGKEYEGKRIGVPADEKGQFILAVNNLKLPVSIEVSSIGFYSKKITIRDLSKSLIIELEEDYKQLQDFTISADKITKEELRSPIQVEKLSLKELQASPSMNYYDAISNLRGVDVTTQSLIVTSVNTRGFNSSTNLRFKQFTDGMDNQAPGLSFSLGSLIGPSNLDIESIELIPGPSTALYGSGAFNGVLDLRTRNPFDYQGLSFSYKGASISVERDNSKMFNIFGGNYLGDYSIRYAKEIVKDKVAFKINLSQLTGADFRADDYRNVGSGPIYEQEHNIFTQGVNGINTYGDERAAYLTLPTVSRLGILTDSVFAVTRTGYKEGLLVNYDANNTKINGALHFKLSPKTQLILASFYGNASTMITGDDRIALRDFEMAQHKIELKNEDFFVRGYTTTQNAGNSFNVGSLAESLVQAAKPDSDWYRHYENAYMFFRNRNPRDLFDTVRTIANSNFPGAFSDRLIPGTEAFNLKQQEIINSQAPGFGAAIFDQSRLYHGDAQMKVRKWDDFFESFILGANVRVYAPDSRGTVFTDSTGNELRNFEYGLFTELSKKLDDRTTASGSIRYDKMRVLKPKQASDYLL